MTWKTNEDALLSLTYKGIPVPIKQFIESHLRQHYCHSLLVYLLNLVGTEIEGQEVSVGFVLTDQGTLLDTPRLGCVEAAISMSVREALHDMHLSLPITPAYDGGPDAVEGQVLATYRSVLRRLREVVLGWTPSDYDQPVLLLRPDNGELQKSPLRICAIRLLRGKHHRTANDVYRSWTSGQQGHGARAAFWIRPAGTIRVYSQGHWVGQIMRLRDTGGWAVRDVSHLTRLLDSIVTRMWGSCKSQPRKVWLRKLVESALALSEKRKGGAIYMMSESLLTKTKPTGITSRTIHRLDVPNVTVGALSETEFACYLEQDGAVVVAPSGKLLALGNYFHGAGGRKKTAEELAGTQKLLALVVSQDGPVYIYSNALRSAERDATTDDERVKKPMRRLDFYLQPV